MNSTYRCTKKQFSEKGNGFLVKTAQIMEAMFAAMSPAGKRGRANWQDVKTTGDLMTDFGAYIQAIGKDFGAFAAFLAETAGESLPSLAIATGVTI